MKKLITLFTLLFSHFASAESVQVSMQIGGEFLQGQIIKQIFTGPNQSVEVWRDAGACNSLLLFDPVLQASNDGIVIKVNGTSQIGQLIGAECKSLTPWSGIISLSLSPSFTADYNFVVLTIDDSEIFNSKGEASAPGVIWNWTKKYVHPHMQKVRIDLRKPIEYLREVLLELVPTVDRTNAMETLRSVRFSELKSDQRGISFTLEIETPVTRILTSQPEPVLDEKELQRFGQALKQWDAFVTFVIKTVAQAAQDTTIRDQLLELLLESRYEILNVLTDDMEGAGVDPVRRLFIDMWRRLSPIAQKISLSLPVDSSIEFISFIAAADALAAIDKLGPNINIEISTFALRRMARLVAPESTKDPLDYHEGVDPELRELFDFGIPLPTWGNDSSHWIDWFIGRARAQTWDRDSIERLNRWLPKRKHIRSYLTRVRWLLEDTADTILRDHPVQKAYRALFSPLVLAVAWQETCWRQYKNIDGKRRPIESTAGAVGLMQVLPSVWRGFYDPHHLAWDIAYNTSAGTEILRHYLVRYAIRHKEHEKTQDIHSLARATYAAYNGGPRQLSRYRRNDAPDRVKRIDQAFWDKYETILNGNALGVLACYN